MVFLKQMLAPCRVHPLLERLASTQPLTTIKRVKIVDGKIRYLLIKVYIHGESVFARTIVRGKPVKTHTSIYDQVKSKMNKLGYCIQTLGGGKMHVDEKTKQIEIYGTSLNYGQANHSTTKEILKSWPQYQDFKIFVSDN